MGRENGVCCVAWWWWWWGFLVRWVRGDATDIGKYRRTALQLLGPARLRECQSFFVSKEVEETMEVKSNRGAMPRTSAFPTAAGGCERRAQDDGAEARCCRGGRPGKCGRRLEETERRWRLCGAGGGWGGEG